MSTESRTDRPPHIAVLSGDVADRPKDPPRPSEDSIADDRGDMRLLRDIADYCARPGSAHTDCLDRILGAAIRFTRAQKGNIQLLDESAALTIVAQRGFDEPFLRFFARVDGETSSACGVALQGAARTVVEDVNHSDVFAGQASIGALLEAGVRAVQSTPLIDSGGTVFGMISTHFTEPHRLEERDLELMDLLARQAADYLARRRAEDALRESEARQAFLLTLSDALRPISDPVAIQATAARLLGEHLRANRVCYVEMSETESVVLQDYVSGVRSIAGRWSNADFGRAMEQALRTGRTNVVSDIRALPGLSDAERASYEAIEVTAQIVVTLFKEGRWIANFGVHSASPREWTKLEVQLTEETAERTWSAVERARAEAALRESEAKYRTLFESMGQGYSAIEMIHGPDGRPVDHRLIELNPAFERLTGIRVTDAIGRTATEVTPGIDPWWFETYDRIAHQGYPERVEYELTALGRWYEAHCFPQGGERLTVLYEDITERKRAEAALRESEEKYRTLFETMGQGYVELQLIRDETGRAVDWVYLALNKAAERLSGIGISIEKLLGQKVSTIYPDVGRWLETFDRISKSGLPERLEQTGTRGQWYEVHVYPQGSDRLVTLYEDIDARKQAEAVLRQSEKRQAFLLKLSDALRTDADPLELQAAATSRVAAARDHVRATLSDAGRDTEDVAELQYQAARALGEYFGAHRVAYWLFETDDFIVIDREWVNGAPAMPRRLPFSGVDAGSRDDLRNGRPLVRDDVRDDPRLSADEKGMRVSVGAVAGATVPLLKGGKLVAILSVSFVAPHKWVDSEIELIADVADRTWSAVQRARAEAALRESEEKFRTLFDSIDEGFTIIEVERDEKGNVSDLIYRQANRAFEHQTGWKDVAGKRASTLLPNLARKRLEMIQGVVDTGEASRGEVYDPDLDSWYDGIYLRVGSAGSPLVACVFKDITERKRAELALRDSEERQAFLLKLSDDFRANPSEDAVGRTCVQALAAQMGVERCYITELSSELKRGLVGPEYHEPGLVPIAGEHRYSDYPDAARGLMNGEPLVTSDVNNDARLSEKDKASIGGGLGLQAIIVAALYEGAGNSIWALTVGSVKPRPWTDEELRLVQDVTERTWAAIERARTQRLALEEAERLIAARTTERDALRRHLAQAEEAERQRLSRELHDQLGQQLTAFRLGLEDAGRLAEEHNDGRRSADAPLIARIGQLKTLSDSMTRGARYIALELRPPELDEFGLASALETYVREWGDRYGIAAELIAPTPSTQPPLDGPEHAEVASALYRIVQESLTNVAKHAEATAVSVVFDRQNGNARLIVEDNGRGFDVDGLRSQSGQEQRLGLAGIRERAALLGGEVTIESSADAGTTLYVRLPISKPASYAGTDTHQNEVARE